MFISGAVVPILLLVKPGQASLSGSGNDPFGLGRKPYEPICAHACRGAIVDNVFLACSIIARAGPSSTSANCYASDSFFLQSLAVCLVQRCGNSTAANSSSRAYWSQYAVGFADDQPSPKLTFDVALSTASDWSFGIKHGIYLDGPRQVTDADYQLQAQALASWNLAEDHHGYFALTLFGCGLLMPVVLSLARFIPFPKAWRSHFEARFVRPLALDQRWLIYFGDKNDVSPTRGQAFFVLYMVAVNAILVGSGHFSQLSSDWELDDRHGKFITCFSNRFGALSLANLPLVILYAGRNNTLIWLTGWSHSTFLILHRWTGYVCIIEAVVHSLLYLSVAVSGNHLVDWSVVPAWYCGAIATVVLAIIIPFTISAMRRRVYELFLITHIVLSIVALIGTYYHLFFLYSQRFSGYNLYLWVAGGIWGFDRLLRVGRLTRNGIRRARITVLDRDYIRIDVPSVRAEGHAYLYFPTLTWRVWENHPFSVTTLSPPTVRASLSGSIWLHTPGTPGTFVSRNSSMTTSAKSRGWWKQEKGLPNPPSSWSPTTPTSTANLFTIPSFQQLDGAGVTFFLRTQRGATSLLRHRKEVPVLMESSYGVPARLTVCPVRLIFAGGVGITACIPYLQAQSCSIVSASTVTKLYWTCRSQALVNALREETRSIDGIVSVNKRIDVTAILYRDCLALGDYVDIAVVVSGPKDMADELRSAVCEIAKHRKGVTKLVDECFGW